jgi:2-dehydro-3-deoxyphosphogluconate aldolase/(4S)-4-hydroxy-2-oxoglutarate aldolase
MIETTVERIRQGGIIAIIRGNFSLDELERMAEALASGGVGLIEITLNSRAALDAVQRLRKHAGTDWLIGAGTVRTAQQVEQAVQAGAQFIVSPNFDPASVARSLAHEVLPLPGVATPSEAQNAFVAGCPLVKLFPADVLGGPAYLKALRAPLEDIGFVPTGGIGLDNMADYRRAGAVAVGLGTALVSEKTNAPGEIKQRAERLRAAWNRAILA